MISRRNLLAGLTTASGMALTGAPAIARSAPKSTFLDVIREPDRVTAFQGLDDPRALRRTSSGWDARGVRVRLEATQTLRAELRAPAIHATHIHLRWNMPVSPGVLALGDAWERSYGDLAWRSFEPQRVMPWYFLTWDASSLHGYGVATGAGALCFWQLDPQGVSLWLDVSNGGSGVRLGERELFAATVVSREGTGVEDPVDAARRFCSTMCEQPRALPSVLYGSNDWYYAYGKNTAHGILRDAELVASVAPDHRVRPFTVIDDGWENGAYGDMAALADGIVQRGVRPGLWIRPLQAPNDAPSNLLLPASRFGSGGSLPAYDPTNPRALALVLEKVRQAAGWGYQLLKHDYTTFEFFGQWGFQMNGQPAIPGWYLYDRTKTNAEIIRELYLQIRHAAGEKVLIIGCNTIGHLGAGIFEAQRTGDDVSGMIWERTRRMGVNTLAYRLPQNRSFFVVDPDCVPITTATPWSLNSQWLDLVAGSGAALFISPQPEAVGTRQRQALRRAFATALEAGERARATDWITSTSPEHWEFSSPSGNVFKEYAWSGTAGAWPFDV